MERIKKIIKIIVYGAMFISPEATIDFWAKTERDIFLKK